eukprot:g51968.t1
MAGTGVFLGVLALLLCLLALLLTIHSLRRLSKEAIYGLVAFSLGDCGSSTFACSLRRMRRCRERRTSFAEDYPCAWQKRRLC